jgi:Peptidase M15
LKKTYNHQSTFPRALWGAARTAILLAGAGFSSVLMVNLPTATSASAHNLGKAASSYVLASNKWITLGADAQGQGLVPASAIEQFSTPLIEKEQTKPPRKPHDVHLASLGRGSPSEEAAGRSLSGGQVRWSASSACLNATLRRVISEVSSNFGPVTVNSTCRSRQRNAGVGGAPRSRHLSGDAVDFSVGGNARAVLAFLGGHRAVGGLKRYADGHFHIDTGPRRTW